MYSMFTSTIAAISTPHGKGGIAVIRVSGDEAIQICEKFVYPISKKNLSSLPSNCAVPVNIMYENGILLDTGIVSVFRSPKSFTGEDTVEISCHGGIVVTQEVLSRALACGAVMAGPGEFTRRAFSSGKISLSQAEAIGNIIDAKSSGSIILSNRNAQGQLSKYTDKIYNEVKSVLSEVYAETDFPDEGLSSMSKEEMRERVEIIVHELESLISTYETGKAVVEGIPTGICGKPNTGKSTLLNLLCREDRAIVTDIAGTTRDVITESVVCGNVTLNISDTAGIRETADEVESEGVRRSLKQMEKSDLLICVFESVFFDKNDEIILRKAKEMQNQGATVLIVINKIDLNDNPDETHFKDFSNIIKISTKNDSYYGTISEAINKLYMCEQLSDISSPVLTNARQKANAEKALNSAKSALTALNESSIDVAGTELEGVMTSLGELDGRQVGIEIVDDIFSRFCVGK